MKNRILIALLTLGVVGLIFINKDLDTPSTLLVQQSAVKPNAFTTKATLREFSADGSIKLIVETDESFYFRNNERIETVDPLIHYTNEHNELLQLNAEKGVYHIDSSIIELQRSVELSRKNDEGSVTLITTQDLSIDTKNDFISTDHPVNITQGSNTLSSVGLKASMQDRKIELPKRVRGTYDLAN